MVWVHDATNPAIMSRVVFFQPLTDVICSKNKAEGYTSRRHSNPIAILCPVTTRQVQAVYSSAKLVYTLPSQPESTGRPSSRGLASSVVQTSNLT